MFDVLQDFEWKRNRKGYRIAPFKELRPHLAQDFPIGADVLWITPKGSQDDEVKYQPFAHRADLCAVFANLKTPEDVHLFANQHGLLTWGGLHVDPVAAGGQIAEHPPSKEYPAGEPVSVALVEAEMFREILRRAETPKALATYFESKISDFARAVQAERIEIVPDLETGLRTRLTLPTLLGAIWYHLVPRISGSRLQACQLRDCGKVFEVGRGTGNRADKVFCCAEHKVEFFNRRRRLARRR
jgi:hypothetical protein